MLTMHLLGHVHARRGKQPLRLSSKSVALLSYLTLEGRPHHREHLAGLLWETPDALRNLRVELARLKGRGVDPFPARQPMLALNCPTDLEGWLATPHPAQERDLIGWLSYLNGPALNGLEDLGTPDFQAWVDQQRQLIHDRIEERLRLALSRYEQQGQDACAALVCARAELLGLELGAPHPPTDRTVPAFRWPAQEELLRQVLVQARKSSQVVVLQGHSETRRDLLRRLVEDTPWTAVQLQATVRQPLLLAALTQHLRQIMTADQRAQLPVSHSHDPETALIELGQLMGAVGQPLLVALHDMPHPAQWPDWLGPMLGFLLDLPLPLALVVSTISPGVASSLRPALGQFAGPRLHAVTLPPVSVQDVTRILDRLANPASAPDDLRRAHATRLVQRSEGIPMYIRALLEDNDRALQGDARLPAQVRDRLLAHLSSFPAPLREQFARLAQIYGRFDPALAASLLGETAPEVLRTGLLNGLLVPAGEAERLTLPHLTYRISDTEHHLTFASEVLRSALASALSPPERQTVRATLATLLLDSQPQLSLIYAARAGLPELSEAADDALLDPPPLPGERQACTKLVGAPEALPHVRHEVRTPGGYRVGLEDGYLEVLRRGPPGPAPLLTLVLPGQGTSHWTLSARVDVASPPQPGVSLSTFLLGVQTGTGPRVVYATGAIPDQNIDGVEQRFGGVLPLGHWFSLTGQGEPGQLELSVRAVDVALTVGALRWGNQTLRDLCRSAFPLETGGREARSVPS
jgi:hypothetical protein